MGKKTKREESTVQRRVINPQVPLFFHSYVQGKHKMMYASLVRRAIRKEEDSYIQVICCRLLIFFRFHLMVFFLSLNTLFFLERSTIFFERITFFFERIATSDLRAALWAAVASIVVYVAIAVLELVSFFVAFLFFYNSFYHLLKSILNLIGLLLPPFILCVLSSHDDDDT